MFCRNAVLLSLTATRSSGLSCGRSWHSQGQGGVRSRKAISLRPASSSTSLLADSISGNSGFCFSFNFFKMQILSLLHDSWSFGILGTGPIFQPAQVSSGKRMHSFSHVKYSPLQLRSLSAFISVFRLSLSLKVWPFKPWCAEEELRAWAILSAPLMTVSPRWMWCHPKRPWWVSGLGFAAYPCIMQDDTHGWTDLPLIKLCWLSLASLVSFIANVFPGGFGSVFFLVWKLSRLIDDRLLCFSFVLPSNKV